MKNGHTHNDLPAVVLAYRENSELSFREIAERLSITKTEVYRAFQKAKAVSETPETMQETTGNGATDANAAQEQNSITAIKNAVSPVSETEQAVSKKRFDFEVIDLVYYSSLATAVFGVSILLGWYAAFLAVPYLCIGFHAYEMAKDPAVTKTAKRGQTAIIVSELLATCSHAYLFFQAIWARKEHLPFKVYETVKGGEWSSDGYVYGWANMEYVVGIAIGFAVVVFLAVWYVVDTRLELTKERAAQSKN